MSVKVYVYLYPKKQTSTEIFTKSPNLEPPNPANIYLFKVNYRSTRKKCKICLKLAIKATEPGIFIVKFEPISHFFYRFYC